MSTDTSPRIAALVTDPDSFFRYRAEHPRLLVAAGIVVVAAVLAAIAAVPQANLTAQASTTAARSAGQGVNRSVADAVGAVFNVLSIVFAFVGIVIPWVLYAAAFYLIARLGFKGDGSFVGTLALTGWGFVPTIVVQIVKIAANYTVYAGETLPSGNAAARHALETIQSDPVLVVASVVAILLLIWSGVLWTYAMDHHHNLSRRNAAITVGIPVAISLVFKLIGLF